MDIYKKYDFSYNADVFMKNLKKALIDKGYTTLGSFHELLKGFGVDSYDTARSYYNSRRVLPIDLFKSICDELNLNATEIMFPNSIEVVENKELFSFGQIFDTFTDIFVTYNDTINPIDEENNLRDDSSSRPYKYYESGVNKLRLIISKYNYLLQQFYYADVSDDRLNYIGKISSNLLVERNTKEKLDWYEFKKWKNELITDNFIKDFYDKYTFALYGYNCNELLNIIRKQIPTKLFNDLNDIMPENDRVKD